MKKEDIIIKIASTCFFIFIFGTSFCQSKNERIELLNKSLDSLNVIISSERSINVQNQKELNSTISILEGQKIELNKSFNTVKSELEQTKLQSKEKDLIISSLNSQLLAVKKENTSMKQSIDSSLNIESNLKSNSLEKDLSLQTKENLNNDVELEHTQFKSPKVNKIPTEQFTPNVVMKIMDEAIQMQCYHIGQAYQLMNSYKLKNVAFENWDQTDKDKLSEHLYLRKYYKFDYHNDINPEFITIFKKYMEDRQITEENYFKQVREKEKHSLCSKEHDEIRIYFLK